MYEKLNTIQYVKINSFQIDCEIGITNYTTKFFLSYQHNGINVFLIDVSMSPYDKKNFLIETTSNKKTSYQDKHYLQNGFNTLKIIYKYIYKKVVGL